MTHLPGARLERAFSDFVAGDDAGFLQLYQYYNPRFGIYTAKRYRLSIEETEDVLQSVWERLLKLRRNGGLYEVQNIGAFLFRTLTNVAIDTLRRRKENIQLTESSLVTNSATFDTETPFARLNAEVLTAFDELSEEHREVLILQLYAGYELSEIAEMLGKSRDALWARASRARNELRKRVMQMSQSKSIPLSEFKVLLGEG